MAFIRHYQRGHQAGQITDAIMCGPNATGFPDRQSDVPVKPLISDNTIKIDDEPRSRRILFSTGQNGKTTFLVDGSASSIHNRERRLGLHKALSQLTQLAATLRPLITTSEEPELASEGLGLLFNWFHDENERLTERQE